MKICPVCKKQYESGNFCENCENQDGSPVRLEEKNVCPKCGKLFDLDKKFCSECGIRLGGTRTESDNSSGISIGDKNVIAGDVVGKKETYNISGNATIIHNEDETKKTAKCHICGSVVQRISGYDCASCGNFTCDECFDKQQGICKNCVKKNEENKEQLYKSRLIEYLTNDNIINAAEFNDLSNLAEQLGISAYRAMQLQDEVKNNARENYELTTFEKLNYEKAVNLFYDEGKSKEALDLVTPIYNVHKENEKIIELYLMLLAEEDTVKAKEIISNLQFDVLGAYLAAIYISIKEKDMATAEKKIEQAKISWPENAMVKSFRAYYSIALYRQFHVDNLLKHAEEVIADLGEAETKLEFNWQVKVQCLLNELQGNEAFDVTREFCKENQLYYAFMNKKI